MKYKIEIRAAEGGDDSKLLIKDMAKAYIALSNKMGWTVDQLKNVENASLETLIIKGKKLEKLKQESGGHRFQRVPPTERKGRVHTSTITIAVIDLEEKHDVDVFSQRDENNFKIEWFSGTGKGGQHRNKHQNSCRLIHLPTGITVSIQGRERKSNLNKAYIEINERLNKNIKDLNNNEINKNRKSQIGSGMRGDKVRTIRVQNDQVVNHLNSKTTSFKKYIKGNIDLVWS